MIMVPKKIKGVVRPAEKKAKAKKKPKQYQVGYGDPYGDQGQFRGTSLQVR